MILRRLARIRDAWADLNRTERLFTIWSGANTALAFALPVGAVALLVAVTAPGFQRTLLLAYTVVAVCWLLSIFLVGPAYDRVTVE